MEDSKLRSQLESLKVLISRVAVNASEDSETDGYGSSALLRDVSSLFGASVALYLDRASGDLQLLTSCGLLSWRPFPEKMPIALSSKATVISGGAFAGLEFDEAHYVEEQLQGCYVIPVLGSSIRGCLLLQPENEAQPDDTIIDVLEILGAFVGIRIEVFRAQVFLENAKQRIAVAGHSARGPLRGVANLVSEIQLILNSSDELREKTGHLVDETFNELERGSRRFESMLYASPNAFDVMSLNAGSVNIEHILQACGDRHLRSAKSRNLRIKIYDSIRRLPTIWGDQEKLDLTFDNLIENAVKYSWRSEDIEIRGWHSSSEIRVSVSDKGLGIPENFFDNIFEGGQRSPVLDRTRYIRGTGLGLHTVRMIVEAHKGRIEVTSVPFLADPERVARYEGYETTFVVVLPTGKRR